MKAKNHDLEWRLLVIASAKLSCEGHSQETVGDCLGKNQSQVSNLLAEARRKGYLNPKPTFLPENIDPGELAQAEQRFLIDETLRNALRAGVPGKLHFDVRVVAAEPDDFPVRAASRVLELIHRSHRIGIMWGRTVMQLVAGIAGTRGSGRHERPRIECIPLCGDPVHLVHQDLAEYSASRLAGALELAINGSKSKQPVLLGVPAYISRKVAVQNPSPAKDWRDFVEGIPGYRAIFKGDGGKRPLIEGVDTIITGAGIIASQAESKEYETAAFIRERMAQEGIGKERFNQLVYGDIGGLLIERENLTATDRKLVKELNLGWTGITQGDLERVAGEAKADGPPGVILVAAGAAKAEMVSKLIQRGYVNELVIDSQLRLGLMALFSPTNRPQAKAKGVKPQVGFR